MPIHFGKRKVWVREVNLQAKNAINKNSFYCVILEVHKKPEVSFPNIQVWT